MEGEVTLVPFILLYGSREHDRLRTSGVVHPDDWRTPFWVSGKGWCPSFTESLLHEDFQDNGTNKPGDFLYLILF